MKTVFLGIIIVLLNFISISQTNVIALKSRSGKLDQLQNEKGNFGLPSREIDSIIYIGQGCVVEVSHHFKPYYNHDTICDHYLLKEKNYNIKALKKLYPDHVKFLNFDLRKKEEKRLKQNPFKNSVPYFIAFVVLTGVGFFGYQTKR